MWNWIYFIHADKNIFKTDLEGYNINCNLLEHIERNDHISQSNIYVENIICYVMQ